MSDTEWLAAQFEKHRSRMRAVAFRMLGSLSEADDAVQEAWLRLSRTDAQGIESLGAWLTTVVSRVCLDMLRSRTARREEELDPHLAASPVVGDPTARKTPDPEQEAMLAESVGLALLVVLDALAPAERISFVLHDLFGVPFEEIAGILGRSEEATRQLASRARRRVHGADIVGAGEIAAQRKLVKRFLAALRSGDVEALIAVLDPDVVIRADAVAQPQEENREVRGARHWAPQAISAARGARFAHPAIIDGSVGLVVAPRGRLFRALRFTYAKGRIAAFEVLGEPESLRKLTITVLEP